MINISNCPAFLLGKELEFMYIRIKRDVALALLMAIIAMGITYIWYAVVGVTDLGNWNHGLRNVLAGVICVFLAELATGRTLLHQSWRPGLIIFYFWLFVFSYIQAKSGGAFGIRVEALNDDVLVLTAALVIISLAEVIGSHHPKARPVLFSFNFLLIGYLSLSIFVYLSYYKIFDAGFTSTDMISVLLTNSEEATEFIESHLGIGSFSLTIALFVVYMVCMAYFIFRGAEAGNEKWGGISALTRRIVIGILILASIGTLFHCIQRIFPAWPYRVAHNYVTGAKAAMALHDGNLEKFHFTGGTPQKLPGTVIVVIGESANRDHLKAFNPSYPAETTPWLSSVKEDDSFFLLKNTYSCYPLTEKALFMMLTNINQYNGRGRDDMITLTDVANKAGYDTWYISNQSPAPGNMALALTEGASKHHTYTTRQGSDDLRVMDYVKDIPKEGSHFVVIHLEGSHDRYKDRVPPGFDRVHVEGNLEKVDDYDTSIAYTDFVLQKIYQYAKDNLNLQAMIYCADHGEDMKRHHGDGKFTWDMVRSPAFVYLSPAYKLLHPDTAQYLRLHTDAIFTNDLVYDMVCGIMNAANTGYDSRYDITGTAYDLTKDKAVTKYGKYHIADDPGL